MSDISKCKNIKLRLISWDAASKSEVLGASHAPTLDLTLKAKKNWGNVVNYLVKKWKGVNDVATRLQIFSVDSHGKPNTDYVSSFSSLTVGNSLCNHPVLAGKSLTADFTPMVALYYHLKSTSPPHPVETNKETVPSASSTKKTIHDSERVITSAGVNSVSECATSAHDGKSQVVDPSTSAFHPQASTMESPIAPSSPIVFSDSLMGAMCNMAEVLGGDKSNISGERSTVPPLPDNCVKPPIAMTSSSPPKSLLPSGQSTATLALPFASTNSSTLGGLGGSCATGSSWVNNMPLFLQPKSSVVDDAAAVAAAAVSVKARAKYSISPSGVNSLNTPPSCAYEPAQGGGEYSMGADTMAAILGDDEFSAVGASKEVVLPTTLATVQECAGGLPSVATGTREVMEDAKSMSLESLGFTDSMIEGLATVNTCCATEVSRVEKVTSNSNNDVRLICPVGHERDNERAPTTNNILESTGTGLGTISSSEKPAACALPVPVSSDKGEERSNESSRCSTQSESVGTETSIESDDAEDKVGRKRNVDRFKNMGDMKVAKLQRVSRGFAFTRDDKSSSFSNSFGSSIPAAILRPNKRKPHMKRITPTYVGPLQSNQSSNKSMSPLHFG
mmetsp:Transcript_23211/g.34066  ORF Transcript_23211/g.34066 Transcript_23211/m.34066 type:complete len:618 (+) Transcript_23211:192-2045(+)|eukprot:CAMPEP_0185037882 /NCGR_PEP_ID=MMETSP1103-20130426/32888_1 /TAXON_ID=36769 /ORGANISM="Paraphysomonas bandaiensis, Strain Caron Lab Isolate" /LENGTH=617 /DNA_ID=CAMNT_0027576067 /DNA_START=128 /DNA_END=1977 /DNA_ORIENTATION=-